MVIKIMDVEERIMRKVENRFKNQVAIDDSEEMGYYNLTFHNGCTLTTHCAPVHEIIIYDCAVEQCICLFENDFSEVHII